MHNVPLVGFAYETCDARDACIAGLDANLEDSSAIEKLVSSYLGLGAPVLFACRQKEMQWWRFTTQGPEFKDKISADQVAKFFHEHHQEFAPESIYRAKTFGRLHSQYQLAFVDIGLMPVLEEKMGEELAKLMKRMLDALHSELGKPNIDKKLGQWLFQSAFWLLGAKILKDKEVKEFSDLDLHDIGETLRRVHNHYNAEQPPARVTESETQALEAAAKIVKSFSSLANLTIESLAYVYENMLITREIRKALGIHATPPYLVDYIVWQLAPWIENIPKEERIVLEPTCGHAPFLVSASRLLREMIDEEDPKKRHDYLKDHLLGVEVDSFAREIARLSLTLTDVPNPNGWQLESADVFEGQALSNAASQSTILLCNPPFEDFTPEQKSWYAEKQTKLKCGNKAAELLWRTLPYMPSGSVFGVILPQGFLHSTRLTNLATLRRMMVEEFELAEICALPENVFLSAKHKSSVIIGRKQKLTQKEVISKSKTRFGRVGKDGLAKFIDHYEAQTECVTQAEFHVEPQFDLRLIPLRDVWKYCNTYDTLSKVVIGGKGLDYKGRDLPPGAETISKKRFKGAVQGYAKFERGIKLTETPSISWMNLDPEVISSERWGTKRGKEQILINYARVSDESWRLKALIDRKGYPVTSRFLVFRTKRKDWSLEALWAILNSPLANAYTYCYSMERDNLTSTIRNIPLPTCEANSLCHLNNLVKAYFALFATGGEVFQPEVDEKEAKRRMLEIDAEVMRLYDLPPKMEKRVLDLFRGVQRRGVDFSFSGYYAEGFESAVPLHEYLSEEYQRSTIMFTDEWVKKHRSAKINAILRKAVEAFEEE